MTDGSKSGRGQLDASVLCGGSHRLSPPNHMGLCRRFQLPNSIRYKGANRISRNLLKTKDGGTF
jgi:hypothetical protein